MKPGDAAEAALDFAGELKRPLTLIIRPDSDPAESVVLTQRDVRLGLQWSAELAYLQAIGNRTAAAVGTAGTPPGRANSLASKPKMSDTSSR